MSKDDLIPVQRGQTGKNHPAAKPLDQHRRKVVTIRVTAAELTKVYEDAKEAGLSISKYGRKQLGLD